MVNKKDPDAFASGSSFFMQFYQMVRSWEAYCCARPSLITV